MNDIVSRHMAQISIYSNGTPEEFMMNTSKPEPQLLVQPKLPLSKLKLIMISDLKLHKIMKGQFLCVQICLPSCKGPSLYIVVKDSTGLMVEASVCNLPRKMTFQQGQEYLPLNSWIAIKNPYYKVYKTGVKGLRIEDKQDIVLLSDYQVNQILKQEKQFSSQELKDQGTKYFKERNYLKSYEFYTLSKNDFQEACLNNRAQCLINLGYIEEALLDINEVLNLNPNNYKALYRKATCYLKLRRPMEAKEIFQNLPNWKQDKDMVQKVLQCEYMRRYSEGQFNLVKLLKEYIGGEEKFDNVYQYVAPIERRDSEIGGKGMFAVKQIKKGDVVLIEKPLHFVEPKWMMDFQEGEPLNSASQALVFEVRDLLLHDKQLAEKLFSLYDGTNQYGVKMIEPDFEYSLPIVNVDLNRIDNIMRLNGHAFQKNKNAGFKQSTLMDEGLWCMLSMINHSCTPNCLYYFIGQVLIVIAAKDIDINEELFVQYYPVSNFEEYKKILQQHEVPVEERVMQEQRNWMLYQGPFKEIEHCCLYQKPVRQMQKYLDQLKQEDYEQLKTNMPFKYIDILNQIAISFLRNLDYPLTLKYKQMNLLFQQEFPQCQFLSDFVAYVLILIQANSFDKTSTQLLFNIGIFMFGKMFVNEADTQNLLFQYCIKQANIT